MTAPVLETTATAAALRLLDSLTFDETTSVLTQLLATAEPQVLAALDTVRILRAKQNLPAPTRGPLVADADTYADAEYDRERADYDGGQA
ncbi:hypothetical protein GCM10009530_63170 [Microbispora corallina]|uniref:Uncharacterized protein n=1 Tax=Microbispora corallina TaxID=83302 RepID=A0ABQ4GBJ7_9ACTN|nr:hypothetical protein [Microbispora corallina]GIH44453.1 hypothetical protein Mco01_74530 [Microbispora corallina]